MAPKALRKTLIVGGTTENGIGEAIWDSIQNHPSISFGDLYIPDPGEMDLEDERDIDFYIEHFGPFDVIVYAAGVNKLTWIKDLNQGVLEKHFRVNVFGLALIASYHEEHFPGHSVNCLAVVSDAADIAMRGSLAYCSSKAAMVSVVKNMARELAPRWRVNAISPGVVEGTPMTGYIDEAVPGFRGWSAEEARKYEASGNPLGRRVTRQEVAELALLTLLGPVAMTGTNTKINGGK